MSKLVINAVTSYLSYLLPNRVNKASNYNLRTGNNFEIPFKTLFLYETSLFPSTLRLWNDLDIRVLSLPTLSQFKCSLKTTPEKVECTSEGERKYNITYTRIRRRCSS